MTSQASWRSDAPTLWVIRNNRNAKASGVCRRSDPGRGPDPAGGSV